MVRFAVGHFNISLSAKILNSMTGPYYIHIPSGTLEPIRRVSRFPDPWLAFRARFPDLSPRVICSFCKCSDDPRKCYVDHRRCSDDQRLCSNDPRLGVNVAGSLLHVETLGWRFVRRCHTANSERPQTTNSQCLVWCTPE